MCIQRGVFALEKPSRSTSQSRVQGEGGTVWRTTPFVVSGYSAPIVPSTWTSKPLGWRVVETCPLCSRSSQRDHTAGLPAGSRGSRDCCWDSKASCGRSHSQLLANWQCGFCPFRQSDVLRVSRWWSTLLPTLVSLRGRGRWSCVNLLGDSRGHLFTKLLQVVVHHKYSQSSIYSNDFKLVESSVQCFLFWLGGLQLLQDLENGAKVLSADGTLMEVKKLERHTTKELLELERLWQEFWRKQNTSKSFRRLSM